MILLRHGRTAWNADGLFQGQLDPPLDSTGLEQAILAAGQLADPPPARLLTSDLQRARVTAEAVGASTGLTPSEHDGLREIDLGDWQGLTREQVQARFPDEYAAWTGGEDVRRGGGETYVEVAERAMAVLEPELRYVAGGTVLAVTHGGTARAVIGHLIGLDPGLWWRLGPLGNCRWSVLAGAERGWRLLAHDRGA